MIKYFIYLLGLLFLLGLTSCGNEEMKFQPIQFNISGVKLTQGNSVVTFHGSITSSETEIIFEATGKYAIDGYLTAFRIGNEYYEPYDKRSEYNDPDVKSSLSGTWGYVEFVKSNPYTTKFVIFENPETTPRTFYIVFGGAYIETEVYLTQEGKVKIQ